MTSVPSDETQLLDQQLCFAVYAASLALTRRYQPLLGELGLTYPQYITLMALWEEDGISVSALGERVALDSGTLTPLLKRMQAAGWLQRQRDAQDERRVRIVLTPAGRALRERAAHVPACMLAATGLAPSEARALASQLRALRQQLVSSTPIERKTP